MVITELQKGIVDANPQLPGEGVVTLLWLEVIGEG